MKNSELRNISKEKMKGKFGKSILYVILYMLIVGILSITPAGAVLGIPLGFGIAKMLVLYEEGKDVKSFDFFKHGMDNFGNAWCTYLLMYLKCFGTMALTFFGFIMSGISEDLFLVIVGSVVGIFGFIWSIHIVLKYSLINYEIIYNPKLKARELMKKCAKDMKGKKWKVARMYIYYGLCIILSAVIFGVLINVITNIIQAEVLSVLLTFVAILFSYIIVVLIQPQMIVALNELYKDITNERNI